MLEDVKAWQNRPLEARYAIVYLDALVVRIRDGQAVRNHACYLAIGVGLDGERDVLGIWFQRSEGAKFWLQVLTDLKQRGVQDVLVCCIDGLTGFPEAIEAVFPPTAGRWEPGERRRSRRVLRALPEGETPSGDSPTHLRQKRARGAARHGEHHAVRRAAPQAQGQPTEVGG